LKTIGRTKEMGKIKTKKWELQKWKGKSKETSRCLDAMTVCTIHDLPQTSCTQ